MTKRQEKERGQQRIRLLHAMRRELRQARAIIRRVSRQQPSRRDDHATSEATR